MQVCNQKIGSFWCSAATEEEKIRAASFSVGEKARRGFTWQLTFRQAYTVTREAKSIHQAILEREDKGFDKQSQTGTESSLLDVFPVRFLWIGKA